MSTTLQSPVYRLTFLTSRLVRLEYQPEGRFEDRPIHLLPVQRFPAGGCAAEPHRSGTGA